MFIGGKVEQGESPPAGEANANHALSHCLTGSAGPGVEQVEKTFGDADSFSDGLEGEPRAALFPVDDLPGVEVSTERRVTATPAGNYGSLLAHAVA